jgi:hypothetical protein
MLMIQMLFVLTGGLRAGMTHKFPYRIDGAKQEEAYNIDDAGSPVIE